MSIKSEFVNILSLPPSLPCVRVFLFLFFLCPSLRTGVWRQPLPSLGFPTQRQNSEFHSEGSRGRRSGWVLTRCKSGINKFHSFFFWHVIFSMALRLLGPGLTTLSRQSWEQVTFVSGCLVLVILLCFHRCKMHGASEKAEFRGFWSLQCGVYFRGLGVFWSLQCGVAFSGGMDSSASMVVLRLL